MEFCRFSNGIQISVIQALLSIMRELLILPLLAFLFHCSWADDPDDPPPVDCQNLVGNYTFDDVKNCKELITKSDEQQYASVIIEKVDEKEWKRFSSELEELYWVDFDILNSNIKVANFPRLRKVHGGPTLNVLDNPVLEEFSLNTEGSDTIHFFAVVISENSQLKNVKVTAADASKFEISGNALELIKNKALENIDLPENGIYKDMNNGFHVKGNPRLKKASLDSLRKLSANIQKKYIQDEGECVFIMEEPYESDIEISDVTELKGCKYVNGDLILAKGVNGSVGDIDHLNVTGAVYLKDPDVKQLSFLTSTTFTSPIECYFTDEVANLDVFQLCTKVQKDLTITGQVGGSGANSVLKEINGSVHLKDPNTGRFDFLTGITNGGIDCTFDVEVTNLDVFRACPKVIGDLKISGKVSGSGANSELKEITGSVHLKDPKNGQFDFLSGIDKVDLDCSFDREVTNWDIFNLCKKVTGDLKLAKDITGSPGITPITEIQGDLHLNNPKPELPEFLKETTIKGSKICHFGVKIFDVKDLTVFNVCEKVEGNLNFGSTASGSVENSILKEVVGSVHLKDPAVGQFDFLSGVKKGDFDCSFDKELSNLDIFKLCPKVTGDLKINGEVSGSGADSILKKVTGTIHLKNPNKGGQFDFLVGIKKAGLDCNFDGDVANLDVFRACPKVIGDLKMTGEISGSSVNSVLKEVTGKIHLKNPNKLEQFYFLVKIKKTDLDCSFDGEPKNLEIFRACPKVIGDLKMTGEVSGSGANSVLKQVTGKIHLKNPKIRQFDFLSRVKASGFDCSFDKEITNFDIFNLCKIVVGDVKLAERVVESRIITGITTINGNVYIKNPWAGLIEFYKEIKITGSKVCHFDVKVDDLTVCTVCEKVEGDLNFVSRVSGSGANCILKEVTGGVHLKDPPIGQFDFLKGVQKNVFDCRFDQVVTDWGIFHLCNVVAGGLTLASDVTGLTTATGVVKVGGLVHLKNPTVALTEFLKQTMVALAMVCHIDIQIVDLTVFNLCTNVEGDLIFGTKVIGSASAPVLAKIDGNVYLNNWDQFDNRERLDFLSGPIITGSIVCSVTNEITDLAVFKLCHKVGSDVKFAANIHGTRALPRINGNVFLKNPKMEQVVFLNKTKIIGYVVCSFDSEIANLTIFQLCQIINGDMYLAINVTGSAGNGQLVQVNGNVDIKDAKEEQLYFLRGTNITGQIVSCHLTYLHPMNVIKMEKCISFSPPRHSGYGSGSKKDEDENNDSTSNGPIIGVVCGVIALLIILIVVGLLLYFFYFKNKSASGTYTGPANPAATKTGKTTTATPKTGKTTSTTPKTGTTKTESPKTAKTDPATPGTDKTKTETPKSDPNAPEMLNTAKEKSEKIATNKSKKAQKSKNTGVASLNNMKSGAIPVSKNAALAPANQNKMTK